MMTAITDMAGGDDSTYSRRFGWLLLFWTSSTLLCCALPMVLVALGLGAVAASLFASLPFLVTLAAHKGWLFASSALLLAVAAALLFRPGRACPADPELAARCEQADRWNRKVLAVSAGIWLLGFLAAYAAMPLYTRYYGA